MEKSVVHKRHVVDMEAMINGFEPIHRNGVCYLIIGVGKELFVYTLAGEKIQGFPTKGTTSEIIYFPKIDGCITNTNGDLNRLDFKEMQFYSDIVEEDKKINVRGDYNPKACRRDEVFIFLSSTTEISFFDTSTMKLLSRSLVTKVNSIQCLEQLQRVYGWYLLVGGKDGIEIYKPDYEIFKKIELGGQRIYSLGFDYVTRNVYVGSEGKGVLLLPDCFPDTPPSDKVEISGFNGFNDINSLLAYDGLLVAGSYLKSQIRVVDTSKKKTTTSESKSEEEGEKKKKNDGKFFDLTRHSKYVNIVKWKNDDRREFIISAGYNGNIHLFSNLKFKEEHCLAFFQQRLMNSDLSERFQYLNDKLLSPSDDDNKNTEILRLSMVDNFNKPEETKIVIFKSLLLFM